MWNKFCKSIWITEHRKSNHATLVPFCRNETNENCTFGAKKCWFRHTNIDNNGENHEKMTGDNNLMQNMFKMMENMTERILKIEGKSTQNENEKIKK